MVPLTTLMLFVALSAMCLQGRGPGVPEADLFPHQLIVVPVVRMVFEVLLMVMVLCPTSVHTFCPRRSDGV